jgi:hypothetical protein
MRKIVYNISEIEPYINWLYFYHAWAYDTQEVIQYSVFSFFRDSYLLYGYKL